MRSRCADTCPRNSGLVWVSLCLMCLLLAAAVATSPDSATAQGGDNDYVDVGLELQIIESLRVSDPDHGLKIVVVNNGSRTAYDVEVVVDLEYPAQSYFWRLNVPVGSVSLERNPDGATDDTRIRWAIPELGGLKREEFTASILDRIGTFDNELVPHEFYGEVTTSSFESSLHEGNNTSRVWSYSRSIGGGKGNFRQAGGDYTVDVSVDNPSPSPGKP